MALPLLSSPSLFQQRPARRLYFCCRLLLVIIFLLSGILKATAPSDFATVIAAYGLLPDAAVLPAAISLIVLEILAAIGLLLEKRGSLLSITAMMVLFISVLSFGIYIGLDVDCGCFGPDDPEAEAFHNLRGALIRDLFIMLAVAYMFLWRRFNSFSPRPWFNFGCH